MIWFGWQVSDSGYRCADGLVLANSPPTAKALACLREEFAESICLEFSRLDCSPESVCEFAGRFGLLKNATSQAEPIAVWQDEVNSLRAVLSVAASGDVSLTAAKYSEGWSRQEGVEAAFMPNVRNSELEFRCMPRDFSSWLWLQVGQTLRERKVGQCKQCDMLFFKGGGKGRRQAQSRSTRRFCSLQCKINYNNLLSKNRRSTE